MSSMPETPEQAQTAAIKGRFMAVLWLTVALTCISLGTSGNDRDWTWWVVIPLFAVAGFAVSAAVRSLTKMSAALVIAATLMIEKELKAAARVSR